MFIETIKDILIRNRDVLKILFGFFDRKVLEKSEVANEIFAIRILVFNLIVESVKFFEMSVRLLCQKVMIICDYF